MEILNLPISTLLVIAGLVFLLLSVATIKKPIVIDITESGRKIAGIIGGILLVGGVVLTPILAKVPTSSTATKSPPSDAANDIPVNDEPRLEVQAIDLPWGGPEDRPPRYIRIPQRVKTFGKTYNIKKDDKLTLWIIICPIRTTSPCFLSTIKLDADGEWDEFIEIGNQDDSCKVFNVTFMLLTEDTSKFATSRAQSGISQQERDGLEFVDKETYEVKRVLDDNYTDILCP